MLKFTDKNGHLWGRSWGLIGKFLGSLEFFFCELQKELSEEGLQNSNEDFQLKNLDLVNLSNKIDNILIDKIYSNSVLYKFEALLDLTNNLCVLAKYILYLYNKINNKIYIISNT